jgi:hypothetical protein
MSIMKKIQPFAVYLVVLMLAGVASLKAEQPGKIQGKAIVTSVHGTATYSSGRTPMPLKVSMKLDPGTVITTGPDSYANLSVNGVSSSVRVQPDTTMSISTMDCIGSEREGDTETILDLKLGSLQGQVKKVSANSTYEIKTPNGVARIRGTDWGIVVHQQSDGQYNVTFTSLAGQVIVSASVDNTLQIKTLNGGESWTPSEGNICKTPFNLLNEFSAVNQGLGFPVVLARVGDLPVTWQVKEPPGKQPCSPFRPPPPHHRPPPHRPPPPPPPPPPPHHPWWWWF